MQHATGENCEPTLRFCEAPSVIVYTFPGNHVTLTAMVVVVLTFLTASYITTVAYSMIVQMRYFFFSPSIIHPAVVSYCPGYGNGNNYRQASFDPRVIRLLLLLSIMTASIFSFCCRYKVFLLRIKLRLNYRLHVSVYINFARVNHVIC